MRKALFTCVVYTNVWYPAWFYKMPLTLSLPGVINFKFPRPAASPEILHHTEFIAYSVEGWLCYQFSLPSLITLFLFLNVGTWVSERVSRHASNYSIKWWRASPQSNSIEYYIIYSGVYAFIRPIISGFICRFHQEVSFTELSYRWGFFFFSWTFISQMPPTLWADTLTLSLLSSKSTFS